MIRTLALTGALALTLGGTAFAQSDAVSATAPADATAAASDRQAWAVRGAVFALRGAYRAIAEAQVLGASPYLDAAKAHYRSALERYGKQDAGAASEAMAAGALARAAMTEHPAPAPRDVPAPPEMTAPAPSVGDGERAGDRMIGGPPGGPPRGPMPGGMRPPMPGGPPPGGPGERGPFDAMRLAADAKLAGTPEAQNLAQKALDADVARTKAEFGGNMDEAMRQGRLASELALAVRSLARAEHPPTERRRMRGTSAGATT
jgi:hypothetical protein